jgi:hypothetical protein
VLPRCARLIRVSGVLSRNLRGGLPASAANGDPVPIGSLLVIPSTGNIPCALRVPLNPILFHHRRRLWNSRQRWSRKKRNDSLRRCGKDPGRDDGASIASGAVTGRAGLTDGALFILIAMPWLIYGAVVFDRLVRYQHKNHHAAWEADGRPTGTYWPSPGSQWPESMVSRGRCLVLWVFSTPAWARGDDYCSSALLRLRIVAFGWWASFIGFVFGKPSHLNHHS